MGCSKSKHATAAAEPITIKRADRTNTDSKVGKHIVEEETKDTPTIVGNESLPLEQETEEVDKEGGVRLDDISEAKNLDKGKDLPEQEGKEIEEKKGQETEVDKEGGVGSKDVSEVNNLDQGKDLLKEEGQEIEEKKGQETEEIDKEGGVRSDDVSKANNLDKGKDLPKEEGKEIEEKKGQETEEVDKEGGVGSKDVSEVKNLDKDEDVPMEEGKQVEKEKGQENGIEEEGQAKENRKKEGGKIAMTEVPGEVQPMEFSNEDLSMMSKYEKGTAGSERSESSLPHPTEVGKEHTSDEIVKVDEALQKTASLEATNPTDTKEDEPASTKEEDLIGEVKVSDLQVSTPEEEEKKD